jgi:hypothetical protein
MPGISPLIRVSVPNWEKFNPRAGRKNYSWFRMQHNFLMDAKIFGLPDGAILLLLLVYGECCKEGKQDVDLNVPLAAALRNSSADQINSYLRLLADKALISLHVGAMMAPKGRLTDVRTDERYDTYEHEKSAHADAEVPSAGGMPSQGLKRVDIDACFEEYKKTVIHFQIERMPGEPQRIEIARGIQRFGAETVRFAFIGARMQKKTPTYDPAQFVSVQSYLKPGRVEQLANLGSGKADIVDWSKICQR